MYNILVVDDDTICLTILKTFLMRWNYEVTTVNHAYDALCALRGKSYDLIMSDVHMPNMDGFELQQHINREYRLPVILISSDPQAELKGVQNGAQSFLVKPIEVEDVKNVWQFSIWWKNKMNNISPPIREINIRFRENVARNTAISSDSIFQPRNGKLAWARDLHNRFVEALVRLGYHRAVPRNILEVMNVSGLTREQVASHLQKYRIFMQRIVDGSIEIDNSHWIDFNYYSSAVSGNPHLLLINQLRCEQGMGELEAPIPAENISSLSGRKRSVPPFTPAEGFGITTLGNACNAKRGNTVGSSSTIYYKFSSASNHIGTSGTAPVLNNFLFNLGGQDRNNVYNGHNVTGNQQVSNGEMSDKKALSGKNIDDGQQRGAGESSDNDLFQFFLDPNLIPGEDEDWDDVLNADVIDAMDVGVAGDMDAQNDA